GPAAIQDAYDLEWVDVNVEWVPNHGGCELPFLDAAKRELSVDPIRIIGFAIDLKGRTAHDPEFECLLPGHLVVGHRTVRNEANEGQIALQIRPYGRSHRDGHGPISRSQQFGR